MSSRVIPHSSTGNARKARNAAGRSGEAAAGGGRSEVKAQPANWERPHGEPRTESPLRGCAAEQTRGRSAFRGLSFLRNRRDRAMGILRDCRLCPRKCGVNRLLGEVGFCRAGDLARVAAVSVHHGEEPPISGTRGSGTVFFSHCNM
ncbi:MAG: Radical SAM domain protein, partial [Actinobacteria bacterium]|nr:Radical SAM domain protein [Actinomycetota bacterium]